MCLELHSNAMVVITYTASLKDFIQHVCTKCGHYTVQFTAKFTTHVVFSRVWFEALAKTRVPHESEPIARVGLVHASQSFSQLCMGVFHVSRYEANESGLDST